MAEYNSLYLELSRRLSVLKAKLAYISASDAQRLAFAQEIDRLLKKLDDRYSKEMYIDDIENDVEKLEKEM